MRLLKTIVFAVLVIGIIAAAGAWYLSGRETGPVVKLDRPGAVVGRQITVNFTATVPGGRVKRLEATLEQDGRAIPIASFTSPADATITQETPDRMRVVRTLGGAALASLHDGPARIVIVASRPVLFGYREATSRTEFMLTVRLKPPTVSVVSMGHRVALGGAEAVLYRVTPADVESGVQVGDLFYKGYPAAGAGLKGDPTLMVAFFALMFDQDAATPIHVVARDPAGNSATAEFDYKVAVKKILRSRVKIDDVYLARAVPAVLKETKDLTAPAGTEAERLAAFLTLNGELRRRNADQIEHIATASAPEMLWKDAFKRLGRSKTESSFAEHRTYIYGGKDVDEQVHLGVDLASTRGAPVTAANAGRVLFAGYLGIYGNTVIIDHGMGLQSLYAHLASMDVEAGDRVTQGEAIGRSGRTGLAAGDHVHFTMLAAGRPVTPVEWWDQHWIQDRILRKFQEAQGAGKQAP